uniref:Matrix protein VP40 n=1 Tax=Lygus hesperus TaxID=30085 RepID=A0A0A9W557_LYGHE
MLIFRFKPQNFKFSRKTEKNSGLLHLFLSNDKNNNTTLFSGENTVKSADTYFTTPKKLDFLLYCNDKNKEFIRGAHPLRLIRTSNQSFSSQWKRGRSIFRNSFIYLFLSRIGVDFQRKDHLVGTTSL